MMITPSYPMKKQQMEMLMKPNRGKDVNRYSLCDVEYSRGTVEGRKILINSRWDFPFIEWPDCLEALVECHWSLIVSIKIWFNSMPAMNRLKRMSKWARVNLNTIPRVSTITWQAIFKLTIHNVEVFLWKSISVSHQMFPNKNCSRLQQHENTLLLKMNTYRIGHWIIIVIASVDKYNCAITTEKSA